jgi:hypothetical protein
VCRFRCFEYVVRAQRLAPSHHPVIADPRPSVELFIVQRGAVAAASHDQHSGGNQLIPNVSGGPCIPRSRRDASGLRES